ncbi:MAG: hypothetical protein II680_12865 [Clostridia bacterium]|nr:hypothetical protein [Clostridia bacterium]
MPSPILDALKAVQGQSAQAPAPAPAMPDGIQNLLGGLNQFRQMFAPIFQSGNPADAARAMLRQRGIDPDAAMKQFGAQASEIQRQLMGLR